MIFHMKFDLKSAVDDAGKEWDSKYAGELEKRFMKRPIKVKLDLDTAKLDSLDAVKKRLAELKIEPITPETKTAIKGLAAELRTLAKALEQVQKYSTARSAASADAVRASKIALNAERARSQAALAAQRAARAEANLAQARLRDARAANVGAAATRNLNREYHNSGGYLQRLAQRMAAYWSVRQVGNFLTSVREVTAQFELQRVSLGAIIQDQNRANQLFSEIKSFALKSPVSIMDLTKYTKQLAAYKIGYDELFETTKKLTDVSVGLGVSMDRVVLAYGQVRATGYLRASEIRQFTEMGVPIVEELAAKLSKMNGELVTAAQVMDMVSKRGISFELVKEVFDDMTSAGGMFYNMQEKQGNTLFGMWAKLGDAASVMYDEIGNTESVNEGMKSAIQLLTELMRNWKAVADMAAFVIAPTALTSVFTKYALSSARKQAADAAATAATKAREAAVLQLSRTVDKGSVDDINAANATLQKAKADEVAAQKAASRTGLMVSGFKSIASSMAIGLGIGAVVAAVTALSYKLFEAWENAGRLRDTLDEIDAERIVVSEQSVRNFEHLADAALDSSKSVKEQKEKLDELHRTFQNMIPVEDMSIENLRRLRDGADNASDAYRSLTDSIREYIALQQKQKAMSEIENEFGTKKITALKNLTDWFNKQGISDNERGRFFAEFDKQAQDSTKTLKEQIVAALNEAGIKGGEEMAKSMIKERGYWDKAMVQLGKSMPLLFGSTAIAYDTTFSDRGYINDYAEATKSLNEEIAKTADFYKGLEGRVGKYSKALEDAKQHMADFVPQGLKEGTFSYQKEMDAERIRSWGKVIVDALKEENVKIENEWFNIDKDKAFNLADVATININAIKEALGAGHGDIKILLDKIAKGYNDVVPKDAVVRSVRDKFEELANAMGLIDKVKGDMMGATEGLEDYRKKINDTAKDYAKQVQNLTKVLSATPAISLAYKEIADKLQNAKDLEEFYSKMAGILGKTTTGSGRKSDPRLGILQEMVSTLKQVNKEYDDLAKKEGATRALTDTHKVYADTFKNMRDLAKEYKFDLPDFGVPTDAASLGRYLDSIREAMKKLPKSDKAVLALQVDIEKSAIDSMQKRIEAMLKSLSDRISRSKTAREFYDKVLGTTGDSRLALRVAESIFGQNGENLQRALADQVRGMTNGIELPEGIISADNIIDYKALRSFADANKKELGGMYDELMKISEQGQKDLAKTFEGYLKDLEKAKTYSDKRIELARYTANQIAEIEASGLPEQEKGRLRQGYREREEREAVKLDYEAFKEMPMYVQMFDDLDNASTAMLTNMRDKLTGMREAWSNLDPTQLKELQSRLREVDEQLAQRNPFKTLGDAVKEYRRLSKEGSKGDAEARLVAATKEQAKAKTALSDALERETKAQAEYNEAVREYGKDSGEAKDAKVRLDFATSTVGRAKELVVVTQRDAEAAQTLVNNWKKVEDSIGMSLNEVFQIAGSLGDLASGIGKLTETFGGSEEDVQYWNDLASGIGEVTSGLESMVKSALSLNVAGIVSGAVTAIPSMISGFANIFSAGKVKRANKEIKRQQELLDQLEYAYSRLEKAMDKAFGGDYITNVKRQKSVLEAQARAYQAQYSAEWGKGKKADEEKLKGYEDAYRDTIDAIADLEGQVAAQMLGSDLTSAARDFAKAWLDAYKEFGSTADAMSGKFKEMIESMVVEGALGRVMERALEPMFDMIDKMGEQDFYSQDFWKRVVAEAEKGADAANAGATTMMRYLEGAGISMRDLGTDLTGISRDIASASEESINGLAAGINTQNYYIAQQLTEVRAIRAFLESGGMAGGGASGYADLVTLQNTAMGHLQSINQHTAETVVECRRIAERCTAMAADIHKVVVPRGTKGAHGIQVYM